MNDHADNERLLSEVLAEGAPTDFREALLDDTLRLARRRRYVRRAQRALPAVAILGVLCFFISHRFTPTRVSPETSGPYVLVRTQSLPPAAILATQPLPPTSQVNSSASSNVFTTALAGYRSREIDDEELLELAAPDPVVLVRLGPHHAELVFANPSPEH